MTERLLRIRMVRCLRCLTKTERLEALQRLIILLKRKFLQVEWLLLFWMAAIRRGLIFMHQIAENQTHISDPGYPLDVAVADNGNIMMVAYQYVDGSETTSYVAFYNFGDVGQSEDDRIVSGYTYEGTVIPQIMYLNGGKSLAVRDDGFTLYKGSQIPKEKETVKVDKEIVSTFYDDDIIGLVFKNGNKEKPYTMRVYSTDGNLKFEKDFNIPYTTIKVSDGNILLYNSSQVCVMNSRGVEKYSGTIDGTISDFIKIGWNRYLLVLDSGVDVIKLS